MIIIIIIIIIILKIQHKRYQLNYKEDPFRCKLHTPKALKP